MTGCFEKAKPPVVIVQQWRDVIYLGESLPGHETDVFKW